MPSLFTQIDFGMLSLYYLWAIKIKVICKCKLKVTLWCQDRLLGRSALFLSRQEMNSAVIWSQNELFSLHHIISYVVYTFTYILRGLFAWIKILNIFRITTFPALSPRKICKCSHDKPQYSIRTGTCLYELFCAHDSSNKQGTSKRRTENNYSKKNKPPGHYFLLPVIPNWLKTIKHNRLKENKR